MRKPRSATYFFYGYPVHRGTQICYVAVFARNPDGYVPLWVVYNRPSDHPGCFVVRETRVYRIGGRQALMAAKCAGTLEEARALVPPGLTRIPRSQHDDPPIVESWL